LRDVLVGNQKNLAVLVELDAPVDDPEELSVKAALTVDGRSGAHLDLASRESFEVRKLHERTLKARGADFQAEAPGREHIVVDVEGLIERIKTTATIEGMELWRDEIRRVPKGPDRERVMAVTKRRVEELRAEQQPEPVEPADEGVI